VRDAAQRHQEVRPGHRPGDPPHREPVPEVPVNDDFSDQIGPREPGGRYYSHVTGETYQVLNVETNRTAWPAWQITIRVLSGSTRAGEVASHCTPWNPENDRVLS
jgi:hypothetical protein